MRRLSESHVLIFILLIAAVISGWSPRSRGLWLAETAPLFGAIVAATMWNQRYAITSLLARTAFIAALFMLVGAHYMYSYVPAGFWIQEWLDLARNPYDRIGHFVTGAVSAIAVREVLVRRTPLRAGSWLTFIVISMALAIAAAYEIIEWLSFIAIGTSAEEFLAVQGDRWDTNWDLVCNLLGACLAHVLFARRHSRELARS
jgi:putative membrane protein